MTEEGATRKTQFEPPPWEKEAFEALAARRAEEQASHEARMASETAGAAPVQEPDPEGEAQLLSADPPMQVAAAAAVASAALPDSSEVEAMLLQLQVEERTDTRATRWVGRVASALTAALGLGMLIAGLVMIRSGGGKSVAVLGSAVLSIFGLSFMGMALWVWITSSRSRGR